MAVWLVLDHDDNERGTPMNATLTSERADILDSLAKARFFLRFTVRDLTEEQLRVRSTCSQLCLGGLIKHVTAAERQWAQFIVMGPSAMPATLEEAFTRHSAQFEVDEADSAASLLATYEEVAAETDQLIETLPDLDARQPLPEAPWFEKGAQWSARQTFLHILAETAHHAGHADIIGEAIDGAKSMG